ncbi:MAG: nicotinate-nucleotide--dimethylbenzimidazole phosphoribosyltransferase [Oscillospiraceae bacterium]|jgi:nicotinate-nucleotide--dimethylbenzimidazole phosphoribosyltransferase|nr:nicotinate-nucleotide--dimethylbenzimidazole phosphoribosyltransferase [Oscillospiraceae bacterium]
MLLNDTIASIKPASRDAMTAAAARWDDLVKPPGSLGMLETIVTRMAGMYGRLPVEPLRKAVIVMCADHGVVAEGVARNGFEVTAMMTEVIGSRKSTVCRMASAAGADVVAVNVGVASTIHSSGVLNRLVRAGTRNMADEPAMTREETIQAIETGIEIAADLARHGYNLLATGEMGIGNTTPSAAIAAALLRLPASETTGRGAGLDDERLANKIAVVERALQLRQPDPFDPIDVLSKVGGLEIAGLTGVILGGASSRAPVLLDGFISSAAALAAKRLCPDSADYMIASHVSRERAAPLLLAALGLEAPINAGMRLGEGTGAVAAMPLLELALAAFRETATLSGTGIWEYVPR